MTDNLKEEVRKRMAMEDIEAAVAESSTTKRGQSSLSDEDTEVLDGAGRTAQTQTRASGIDARVGPDLAGIGFERIGADTDASRVAYRRGDLVVKLEPMGSWRNENEVKNWLERLPSDSRSLFAPVLDHHPEHYWVAMRYADPDLVTDDAHARLLRALIVDHNLDMTDPHPDNVGMLNGRAVLIDYNFRPKTVGETRQERLDALDEKLRHYDLTL